MASADIETILKEVQAILILQKLIESKTQRVVDRMHMMEGRIEALERGLNRSPPQP